ncbi:CPBP family intramembrane glutamic endopeptidase [Furfurilactobacillus siliginis]|nr:type II CAAX endopeptidase family protein [Furfurilactobacillus siliginis]KRN94684.1 hypothetical protein IV55_GL000452 [Furfurilactobacillus siliginis]
MNETPDATTRPFFNRLVEAIIFLLVVSLLPAILSFNPHATFNNASGYLLLFCYWAAFIVTIIIAAKRFRYWSGQRLFHDFKFRDLGIVIGAYIAILLVENLLLALQKALYHQQSTANNDAIIALMKHSPVMLVGMAVSAVFLTPFLEELVFRGLITNLFFKPGHLWPKLLLSALLFSGAHLSTNPISFLVYFCMGFILAAVYQLTQKQFNSIMVHFLINALSMTQIILLVLK